MTKIGKCALGTIVCAGLVIGRAEVAHAQGSRDEQPPAESSVAHESAPAAGGIRVVERSGDHDAAFALQSVGAGLAVLGVATLAIEGVVFAASVCLFDPDCPGAHLEAPPVEVSWAALGAIGGGLVMALVGVLLDVVAPSGPDTTRISARPWLHVDDTGGTGGVSIDL